ncbi:MAG: hypothetical protein KKD69_00670 [Euryarchaeota archaeon]|nr:hypothetical protein [Euryarchaeota archaeon]MBU4490961.1 hypothetical protein [Euryarchaeota archaeon]MCG2727486.1 hypothetical protein [Candidatus Methanoperedenaceae archaeon]
MTVIDTDFLIFILRGKGASGKPLDIQDVLIAGIVMANKEEILTRNTEHFSRISGLRWRRW